MKKKQLLISIILIIVAALALLFYQYHKSNLPETNLQKVEYVRAKDGDTLVVNDGKEDLTVRLIGIDTPESVHPDESKNTKEGENASEYTKNLLKDTKTLYLEYDNERQDKYNRILAYVWLSEDTTNIENMLNKKLITDGYAVPLTIEPNTKYKNQLR